MKIASFFSGAGGFDLGFQQAGHEIVYAMDFDKYCKQTYDANFDIDMELKDFNLLKPEDIPEADVFIGGPPCQDFSIAGKGAGIDGERGSLINKYVELIGKVKPKWVVIENVKGLLSKRHRPAFDALCEKLCSFGYVVSWKVLNSKDFGVPQNRNRVFIVAGPHEFMFPEGEELDKCLADVMDDIVDEKYYLSDKAEVRLRNEPKKDPSDIASTLMAAYYKQGFHHNYIKTPHKIGWVGNDGVINQGGLLNRIYDGHGIAPTSISSGGRLVQVGCIGNNSQGNRIYDPSGISTTQCGTAGGPGGKTGLYKTNRIRRLTPRECARLQGFDDEFVFPVSDTQTYKQCGNAVTVNVAKAIGEQINE